MHGEGAPNFPNTLTETGEELALSEPFVKGLQLKPFALYTGDPFPPLLSNSKVSPNIKLGIIF